MKKIFSLVLFLSLLSCQKEEVCNCGLIVDDDVSTYSVLIRNSCTNNEKWFTLQPGDWMNAHPGQDYCITNVEKW